MEDYFRCHKPMHCSLLRILLKDRQTLMFRSAFREDSSLKSLHDLPGEIRNMIYRLALFGQDPKPTLLIKMNDHRKKIIHYPRDSRCKFHPEQLTISTPHMLCAVSKQIRQEVRSLFWSTIEIKFSMAYANQSHYIPAAFDCTGPEAAGSLLKLRHGIARQNCLSSNTQHFRRLSSKLPVCANITSLHLNMMAQAVFPVDDGFLHPHFVKGETSKSPTLDVFADLIADTPALTNLCLAMYTHKCWGLLEKFEQFICTGVARRCFGER